MPPQARRDIADIGRALRERHGCHTAIVYGSFATGDAVLRGLRFPGPKKALAQPRAGSPAVYSILEAALNAGASLATIARAVETVAGPRDEESVARELGGSPKGV